MNDNQTRREEIRREDRRQLPKFILILIACGLLGGVLGFLFTSFSLSSSETLPWLGTVALPTVMPVLMWLTIAAILIYCVPRLRRAQAAWRETAGEESERERAGAGGGRRPDTVAHLFQPGAGAALHLLWHQRLRHPDHVGAVGARGHRFPDLLQRRHPRPAHRDGGADIPSTAGCQPGTGDESGEGRLGLFRWTFNASGCAAWTRRSWPARTAPGLPPTAWGRSSARGAGLSRCSAASSGG